jgi:hypothetical protein
VLVLTLAAPPPTSATTTAPTASALTVVIVGRQFGGLRRLAKFAFGAGAGVAFATFVASGYFGRGIGIEGNRCSFALGHGGRAAILTTITVTATTTPTTASPATILAVDRLSVGGMIFVAGLERFGFVLVFVSR